MARNLAYEELILTCEGLITQKKGGKTPSEVLESAIGGFITMCCAFR